MTSAAKAGWETEIAKGGVKYDAGKPRHDLIDAEAMTELAKVLTFGAQKYEEENWRKGISFKRLIAAAERHINAIKLCEDTDEETGLQHAAHAMCCMMFLSWMQRHRKDMDDRYRSDMQVKKENPLHLMLMGEDFKKACDNLYFDKKEQRLKVDLGATLHPNGRQAEMDRLDAIASAVAQEEVKALLATPVTHENLQPGVWVVLKGSEYRNHDHWCVLGAVEQSNPVYHLARNNDVGKTECCDVYLHEVAEIVA